MKHYEAFCEHCGKDVEIVVSELGAEIIWEVWITDDNRVEWQQADLVPGDELIACCSECGRDIGYWNEDDTKTFKIVESKVAKK